MNERLVAVLARERPRILVVASPAHGDVLLTTPLIAALRRHRPGSVIDVLVYRGQEGILEGNTDVDEVLAGSKHPRWPEYRALLRRLFRRYDLALSTKHTDRAILYTVAAAPRRVASVPPGRDPWKRWLTDAHIEYDHWGTHMLVQNAALAVTLGLDARTDPRLPTRPEAAALLDELLPPGARPAVLHLNPGLPHKRWTFEGWAAVARFLHERGCTLVLTGDGSPAEMAYLEEATAHMPVRPVNLAGRLRFADLTELLRRAELCVGIDTVASHMAAAAGLPTVALFGPEPPAVWGPWPSGGRYEKTPYPGPGTQRAGNVLVVQATQPCPTCRQGDCLRRRERRRSCTLMQYLDGGYVVEEIDRLLADLPTRSQIMSTATP